MRVKLRNPDREVEVAGGREHRVAREAEVVVGYLDRGMPLFRSEDRADLRPCEQCGQPTTGRFCTFCRARAQVLGDRLGGSGGPTDREIAQESSDEVLPVEIYGGARA